MQGHYRYWGKAGGDATSVACHLLPYHALDVAAVAEAFLDRSPWLDRLTQVSGFTRASLRAVVPRLLALHDLGKFGETFQDQRSDLVATFHGAVRPPRYQRVHHATAGYLLWREWLLKPERVEIDLSASLHPVQVAGERLDPRTTADVLESWMASVLGHHGRPPDSGASLPLEVFARRPTPSESRLDAGSFARAALDLFGSEPLVAEDPDLDAVVERAKRASWWVAGFTILCDWVGSGPEFAYVAEPLPLSQYLVDARDRARRAVSRTGLLAATPLPHEGIRALFPHLVTATPLQRAAGEVALGRGPALFVLEDLTGAGKTEAAMVLAHRLVAERRAEGVFFALPTMATANAMHARLEPLLESLFAGQPSSVLAHGGVRLSDRDRLSIAGGADDQYGRGEPDTASRAASAWIADSRKKSLLAHLGVGTIDQALLAVLQNTHAALRLFGLHRSVLVVDEVHACDAYVLRILRELLEVHAAFGGSAILLSATLPQRVRCELIRAFRKGTGAPRGEAGPASAAYPLLTGVSSAGLEERPLAPREGSPRRLPVRWHDTEDAVVARLASAAKAGLCACWIRNSVKDALEGWQKVSAAVGAVNVELFHARFALGDRLRREIGIVGRFGPAGSAKDRRGRVVVATQVVEQSLDLDFDVLVTDLCPVDLVIQRAGRLQRHRRAEARPPPVIEVLAPPWTDDPPVGWLRGAFARTAVVYPDPAVLWRTARALRETGGLDLPAQARALVEAVHGDDQDVPAAFTRRSDAALGADLSRESLALTATLKLGHGYMKVGAEWSDESRAPTRLGEPTTIVRLARPEGDRFVPWWSEGRLDVRWRLSEVSVPRRLITSGVPDDQKDVEPLVASQPFIGSGIVTVPLRRVSGGWAGRALATRVRGGTSLDVPVKLTYDVERGLAVKEV